MVEYWGRILLWVLQAAYGFWGIPNHGLAVLSNKPGDATRAILAHLGVDGLFFRMLGGGDLPNLKPAPDGIEALMEESGISAENTWMIGDHHTDLEGPIMPE